MPDIRLILLDLDGTLLNSAKELTARSRAVLQRAADAGVEIVPATGRFFDGMPEQIRALPFVHYAVTINGAEVLDLRRNRPLYTAEIPFSRAIEIMRWLDTLPVIYDCYMDNWGWMTAAHREQAAEFAPNAHYLKMIRELRKPVSELKAFLEEKQRGVQKIQLFMRDASQKAALMSELTRRFPETAVSSSVANNVEINDSGANKGEALRQLAAHLELDILQTMAFGDGLNDLAMIQAAGIGVVMENGEAELKQAAKYVTASCDADGVALAIEKFCL